MIFHEGQMKKLYLTTTYIFSLIINSINTYLKDYIRENNI